MVKRWRDGEGVHLDLRGLEPPEPMIAILQEIDGNSDGDVVTAVMDREPIFVYPEIEERNWTWRVAEGADPGPFVLVFSKDMPS